MIRGIDVHRERCRATFGDRTHELGVDERMQEADERLAGAEEPDLVERWFLYLHDQVGAGVEGRRVRGDLRAALRVGIVVERGCGPRARLDDELISRRRETCGRLGNEGHAPFPGRGLPGDAHPHTALEDMRWPQAEAGTTDTR